MTLLEQLKQTARNNLVFLLFSFLILFGASGVWINHNSQKREAEMLINFVNTKITEIEEKFTQISVFNQNLTFTSQSYVDTIAKLQEYNSFLLQTERSTPVKNYNPEFTNLGDTFRNFVLTIHFETVSPAIETYQSQLDLIEDYRQYANLKRSLEVRSKEETQRSLESYKKIVDSEIALSDNITSPEAKQSRKDRLFKIKEAISISQETLASSEETINESVKKIISDSLKNYFPPEKVLFPSVSFNTLVNSDYQQQFLLIRDYAIKLAEKYSLSS